MGGKTPTADSVSYCRCSREFNHFAPFRIVALGMPIPAGVTVIVSRTHGRRRVILLLIMHHKEIAKKLVKASP